MDIDWGPEAAPPAGRRARGRPPTSPLRLLVDVILSQPILCEQRSKPAAPSAPETNEAERFERWRGDGV